jgi:hypothetical protein
MRRLNDLEKILVEIYLPAVNQNYDVYIPLTSKLHEVTDLLANAFTELSNGYFTASQDTVLCDKATGHLLDINKSVLELGLYNGSRLMLI